MLLRVYLLTIAHQLCAAEDVEQSCSNGSPNFAACARLNREQQESWMLSNPHLTKQSFFAQIRNATMPDNITGVQSLNCKSRILAPVAKRVALVGDSIVRELAAVLGKLLGENLSFTFYQVYNVGKADSYSFSMPLSAIYGNTSFLRMKHLVSHDSRVRLWPSLSAEAWDAVFVGGLGLHTLLRYASAGWQDAQNRLPYLDGQNRTLYSPYLHHRKIVQQWATRFLCLSRALRTPFVFVGTTLVDSHVIFLDPPKHDWDEFHDFGLASVMARAELDVEHEFRQHRDSVSFLRPSELARACPGARCDGMHYDSHSKADQCYSSMSLWCPLVSFFVSCKLPSLLRRKSLCSHGFSSTPQMPSLQLAGTDCFAHRQTGSCFGTTSQGRAPTPHARWNS